MADQSALMVIVCPCGQKMKVPESSLGKVFKCVRCGEHVQVREDNLIAPGETVPQQRKADSKPQEPVGQLLIRAGLIQAQDLQIALDKQREAGGKTFDILIRLGKLDKDALHRFLSKQPGIATIDLSRLALDRTLIELIPKTLALEHLVLPVDRLGKLLTVAMACPLDAFTIAELENITGLKVKAMLCRLDDIHEAVKKYYPEQHAAENDAFYEKLLAKTGPAERREAIPDVRKIESLSCSTDILQRLSACLRQPQPAAKETATLLLQDPALAAYMLSRANLPAYGLPGRVETVPMAVAVLGMSALGRLVEQLSAAAPPKNGALQDHLAERGRKLAGIAEALASASGKVSPRLAQTAGLLAEIGRYVLAGQAIDRYTKHLAALQGRALAEAEQKAFSTNYAETGAALALAWRLPEVLSRALLDQLSDLGQSGTESSLSAVLSLCLRVVDGPPEDLAFRLQKEQKILEVLELTPADVMAAVEPLTTSPAH